VTDIPDFETFCAELLGEPISKAWATFYRSVEGLPLDEEGVELFRLCTGRDRYEPRVYTSVTGICGRRSEKTQTSLKFLIWKALFAGWEKHGSWIRRAARTVRRLRIPVIAQDTRVSNDILRTAEALCMDSPFVRETIAEVRVREVVFKNGASLIGLPASKASTRGMPCPGCLLDELAWVSIEGADDKELVRQVKPSMIQFGEARRLIKLSTPWRSSGVIFDEFSHRLETPDLLVWQAATSVMTPRIPAAELERERTADPAYFAREYQAIFAAGGDLEAFLPAVDIRAAIGDWRELAPKAEPYYVAALDASSLTGGDRFTFGIAHSGDAGVAVDVLRGWRREAVPQVCDEIASLCKLYRVRNVIADQFSHAFLAELLRQREIGLEQLAFTARNKPELFFDLKTSLAQGKFRIPDHPEAIRELHALESLKTSGGNYKISAPRGLHDDFVTVLAILANKVKRSARKLFIPEIIEVRIGVPPPAPGPGTWVDQHADKNLNDPFTEGRFWHEV
jgi:hypothetical protein